MHYLVTGHTGFKGAWLTLLLAERGHSVSGIALDPAQGTLYEKAALRDVLENDLRVDIRDAVALADAVRHVEPDIVVHLAAQALVRTSYEQPRLTFETNAIGTLNLLEAVSRVPSVKANLVITTDKVYRNVNQMQGYVESDPLGGDDPYSASKAMADLLTQSWIKSFPGVPTAIARAGNVIGGGDIGRDRLLPDLVSSFAAGTATALRYPDAVRPWQHVLDCLNGYLSLIEAIVSGRARGEWNFGPDEDSFVPVRTVADLAAQYWGQDARWAAETGNHPHEAGLLALDASKARTELGWRNKLSFTEAVGWTIDWEKQTRGGTAARAATIEQIRRFESTQ
jgi:CDP-glucose 4,6-dehydratase